MPFVEYGRGGTNPLFAYTFWYGLVPVNDDDDDGPDEYFPAMAYHPSLHGRTVEVEARRLLTRYGQLTGLGGFPMPEGTPKTIAFSNLKLWGRWSARGLHLSLCVCHPVDPSIIGKEVISGFVDSDRNFFLRFARLCSERNGLAVTLLDDDLNHQWQTVKLLVERFSFVIERDEPFATR